MVVEPEEASGVVNRNEPVGNYRYDVVVYLFEHKAFWRFFGTVLPTMDSREFYCCKDTK